MQFSPHTQHVLLTGATGFIGPHLVRALLADGKQVTVLARNLPRASRLLGPQVRCIASLDEITPQQPIELIINLAGAPVLGPRWSDARKQALHASRSGFTTKLVAWIASRERKPRLLLSASAVGYYGIQALDDSRALIESSAPQPIFMSELCQRWEAAAHTAVSHGVAVCVLRLGVVFGAQGALPKLLLPIKLGVGGVLGNGQQSLPWIHLQDVLAAFAHVSRVAENGDAQGAYNLTAPEQVTQKQFAQTAAKLLHRPCFIPTPAWPVKLALGEQAQLLLDGQRVLPQRLLEQGFVFAYPQLRQALLSLL